jgi:dipeptidyl aminopeptidase/acylaminoacyl peptidase
MSRLAGWIVVAGLLAGPVSAAELSSTTVPSTRDGVAQKVKYFVPANVAAPVPLLVVLHTWSGDVNQTGFVEPCLAECAQRGWAMIHPDFRGPNVRPEACASDLAVQDIVDAVAWIETQTKIDPQRRYVTGASGGGHMTLIMAGRHPELWAGASAWVPISNLAAWHAESVARKQKYFQNIETACGGKPGDSAAVDEQYRLRSPLTHLANAKGLPIDINTGINDGHTGSVPVSQSLRAFNLLADVNGKPAAKFTAAEIAQLSERRDIDSVGPRPAETGRQHPILVRRMAGTARLTVFDGGHEGDMPTAIRWLAMQRRP